MHLRHLHISDLHLTGQVKEEDGRAVEWFNQNVVTYSMLEAIERLVREEDKAFDLIFISGDLAKRGKPEEYQVAEVFCQRLVEATSVPAERFFLVPGNHDVTRARSMSVTSSGGISSTTKTRLGASWAPQMPFQS
jgi:3',5'-cyclic AMP phosphodiesterase CpdA